MKPQPIRLGFFIVIHFGVKKFFGHWDFCFASPSYTISDFLPLTIRFAWSSYKMKFGTRNSPSKLFVSHDCHTQNVPNVPEVPTQVPDVPDVPQCNLTWWILFRIIVRHPKKKMKFPLRGSDKLFRTWGCHTHICETKWLPEWSGNSPNIPRIVLHAKLKIQRDEPEKNYLILREINLYK